MIDVAAIRRRQFPVLRHAYTERDAILYALALGYGEDPLSEDQLRFVYEPNLRVVPTFINVLGHPGFWIADPQTGIDARQAVNAEHRVRFHAAIASRAIAQAQTRVLDVIDRGKDKGALLITERQVFDDNDGALLATIEQHTLCRADGGFSGASSAPSANTVKPPRALEREPDYVVELRVLPQAALLYRQSSDLNPLHADPDVARKAGFTGPVVHGLCTFGIACRAVLQACTGSDPSRLLALSGRFSAPVYPGDALRTEIWCDDANRSDLRLRCTVPARGSVVLSNGSAQIAT